MRRFAQETAAADYSWARPNRRYAAQGLFIPSLHSQQVGHFVIAVDTSGSIDKVAYDQFMGDVNAIVDDVKPSRVTVICCDRKIHGDPEVFEQGEHVDVEPLGGGGTDLRPPFEAVEDMGDDPAALIYFTDLDGITPDDAPEYPVLWACTGQGKEAPFGELVELDT